MSRAEYMRNYRNKRKGMSPETKVKFEAARAEFAAKTAHMTDQEVDDHINQIVHDVRHTTTSFVNATDTANINITRPVETAIDVALPTTDLLIDVVPREELIRAQERIVELEEEVKLLKRKLAGKAEPVTKVYGGKAQDVFDYSDWLKDLHPDDRHFFEQRLGKKTK